MVVENGREYTLAKTGTPVLFNSYLQMEWLKTVPIRFEFHANLSMLAIHHRFTGDPMGQIAECCK